MQRALFTAQDPKTLRQAFATLKPNHEMRPLYEAAVARQRNAPSCPISTERVCLLFKNIEVRRVTKTRLPTAQQLRVWFIYFSGYASSANSQMRC